MFGHRYFGARYWGPRYWGPGAAVAARRGGGGRPWEVYGRDRVERATTLAVQDDCVTGGAEPHHVDLLAGTCDCADFQYRGGWCKHLLAARAAAGDPLVVAAMQIVNPPPRRDVKSAVTRFRKGG